MKRRNTYGLGLYWMHLQWRRRYYRTVTLMSQEKTTNKLYWKEWSLKEFLYFKLFWGVSLRKNFFPEAAWQKGDFFDLLGSFKQLSRPINKYGNQPSWVKPRNTWLFYTYIFLCCQMSWHKNSWENALQFPGSLKVGSLFINEKTSKFSPGYDEAL